MHRQNFRCRSAAHGVGQECVSDDAKARLETPSPRLSQNRNQDSITEVEPDKHAQRSRSAYLGSEGGRLVVVFAALKLRYAGRGAR